MYYSHEINSELFDSNAINYVLKRLNYDVKLCHAT